MLLAISGTLKSAVWALSLLGVIMYLAGIVFTQATVDFLSEPSNGQGSDNIAEQILQDRFGSLPDSMYTLFMAMCNGIDWGDLSTPLAQAGDHYVAVFIFYIFFTYFGLMNVITSVFVQSA